MRLQDELLGFAEVVDLLGIPERTVARYVQRQDFPEPVARLAAGPVWLRADVKRWAGAELPAKAKRARKPATARPRPK